MKTQIKFPNSSLVSVVNGSIVVKDSTGEEHTFVNASVVSVNNGTIIIESKWKPKQGELIKYYLSSGHIRYAIFREIAGDRCWTYGSSFETLSEIPWDNNQPKFRYCSNMFNLSSVTPEEQKEFDDFCKSQGKLWNKETLQWEKYKWQPKDGDSYYYIDLEFVDCVGKHSYKNDSLDQNNYEHCNCFQTKEQAERAAEKVKELLKSL